MAFGIPVYNQAHQLEESLESILNQAFAEFGVVAVDDGSGDESFEILQRYALRDPRLRVFRNPRRLGYTRNAWYAYQRCTELFPSIEYFAWGSDHDVWHPQWLNLLSSRLENEPNASLAYSWFRVISSDGTILHSRTLTSERGSSQKRGDRIRFVVEDASAGALVYGLFRVSALQKTSGLRLVIAPDVLLLLQLAALGTFVAVPEFLWHRRYYGLFSRARQRRNSFPDSLPLHTYLPTSLQHSAILLDDLVIRPALHQSISRREGLLVVREYIQRRRLLRRQRQDRHRGKEKLKQAKRLGRLRAELATTDGFVSRSKIRVRVLVLLIRNVTKWQFREFLTIQGSRTAK
jgi:glycosyltransferase involved in cell wall biosynthesis